MSLAEFAKVGQDHRRHADHRGEAESDVLRPVDRDPPFNQRTCSRPVPLDQGQPRRAYVRLADAVRLPRGLRDLQTLALVLRRLGEVAELPETSDQP